MTYPEMIEADWLLRNDIQLITLGTIEGIHAQSRKLNWREAQLGAAIGLEPTDQVFVCSINELGDYTPKRGDVIADNSGTNWTIVSLAQTNFAGMPVFYELTTRIQFGSET